MKLKSRDTTGVWEMCPSGVRGKAPGQGVKAINFAFISNFKLKYAEIQQESTHTRHFCATIIQLTHFGQYTVGRIIACVVHSCTIH